MIAGQPHWTSLGQIYKQLGIAGEQVDRVKGRILLEAPKKGDDDPKQEPVAQDPPSGDENPLKGQDDPNKDCPEKEKDPKDDPKDDPNKEKPNKNKPPCKEEILINSISKEDLGEHFTASHAQELAHNFAKIRSVLIQHNGLGFESYQHLIGHLKEHKETLLIEQFEALKECLVFNTLVNPPGPTPNKPSFKVNSDSEDIMVAILGKDLNGEDRAAFLDFRKNLRKPIQNFEDLIARLKRREKDKTHMQNLIKVFTKYKDQLDYSTDLS